MNLKILFLIFSIGDIDVCQSHFKNIFFKGNEISKNILLVGDSNVKVQNFINLMFQFGLIPTTNKPRRIRKDTFLL